MELMFEQAVGNSLSRHSVQSEIFATIHEGNAHLPQSGYFS